MKHEQIEYKGVIYDLTPYGLASEYYRRQNEKKDKYNLDKDFNEVEVAHCEHWLREYAKPRKTVNDRYGTSYTMKHVVEQWAGHYISNGAFILAARRMGIEIRPSDPLSLNAFFCLSYSKEAFKDPRHGV